MTIINRLNLWINTIKNFKIQKQKKKNCQKISNFGLPRIVSAIMSDDEQCKLVARSRTQCTHVDMSRIGQSVPLFKRITLIFITEMPIIQILI